MSGQMRKVVPVVAALFLAAAFISPAFGQGRLSLFVKGNFVSSSGSAADYVAGENDFPICEAHQNMGVGIGYEIGRSRVFGGIEIHYNLSGKAALVDPSDNDRVEIDTYTSLSGLAVLGVNVLQLSRVRLYVQAGVGANVLLGTEVKTYSSTLGYDTEINPPDRKIPLTGFGGVGIDLAMTSGLSARLGFRYQHVATEQPQGMFVVVAGLKIGR